MAKKKAVKSKTNIKKKAKVKSAAKTETKAQEKKKGKKKILIPLFCLLGVVALAGAGVGIYFALQPKVPTLKVNVSSGIEGSITLSNKRAVKGKDYITEINIKEEKISEGYTLPIFLTKVVSGNRELKSDTDPKQYTYEVKDNNKSADFKIFGEFVEGDITIELTLVPPKERHNVYWYNYDGTLLEEDIGVEEGTIPTYDGDDPTSYGDEKTKKIWNGWDHEPEVVTKTDQYYTAKYDDQEVTPGDFYMAVELKKEELPATIKLTCDSATATTPTIDWGDGSSSNGEYTHEYKKAGQYGIRVNNIISIGTFDGDYSKKTSYVKNIYLGDSITNLLERAFYNNRSLSLVKFGDDPSLKTIGEYSFCRCESLKNITIPSSVETIGEGVFSVTGLEEVIFNNDSNLAQIDKAAFQYCNIKTLCIPENKNNADQTIAKGAFGYCNQLFALYIPSTAKPSSEASGSDSIVYGSESLKHIFCGVTAEPSDWPADWNKIINDTQEYPRRPTSWWNYAYYGKDSNGFDYAIDNNNNGSIVRYTGDVVDELEIPDYVDGKQVTLIIDKAFEGNNFTSITLPTTLIKIGKKAFYACRALEEISIPASVKTIDEEAFTNCSELTTVNFSNDSELTEIGQYAFNRTNVSSINLPSNLKTIASDAFHDCKNLKSVVIPSSVETIGDYAFYACPILKEVDLTAFNAPPTLQVKDPNVGCKAFSECDPDLKLIVKDSTTKALFDEANGWKDYIDKIVAKQ